MAQHNIMEEYIKLTKNHMKQYMELVFEDRFKDSVFESFLEGYVNARYYDLNGYQNDNSLKTEILLELEKRKEKLLETEKTKRQLVEHMYDFFEQLLYFDRVVPSKDLERTVDVVYSLRKKLLEKDEKEFKQKLTKALEENTKQLDDLLKKYETSDFYISISNYKTVRNVYRATLKYNFSVPIIYSNFAINKAFSTGTTNEDKIFIEYILMSVQIIQDIIRGNFKKQYIVEFAESLFGKPQKLERTLGLVNNQVIQDKLNFKITYAIFIKNKAKIYELIKKGFRFAVIIDDTFESSLEDLEKLSIFKFVLINENAKWYHKVIESIDTKNIIEI